MPTDFFPLRVLVLTLSGFVNRHQTDVIAYLVEENPAPSPISHQSLGLPG